MKKGLLLLIVAIFLAACATVKVRQRVTDPVDREYLASVWTDSLEFVLPDGDLAELAWYRAQVFVARFGAPIAHSYSYSISTLNPRFYTSVGSVASIAYTVTRLKEGNKVYFAIAAYAFGDTYADRLNSRMLSRYMRTGQLRAHLLNRDFDIGSIINPSTP